MIPEITAALSSLKVVSDLATLIQKSKVDAAVAEKAIELQSAVISLQSAMLTLQSQHDVLLTENNQLKQQLIDVKNWETESQNYHLKAIRSGVFVYATKPDMQSAEPQHWLCANCYQNKKKSLLQQGSKERIGWNHHCPHCKTDIYGAAMSSETDEIP